MPEYRIGLELTKEVNDILKSHEETMRELMSKLEELKKSLEGLFGKDKTKEKEKEKETKSFWESRLGKIVEYLGSIGLILHSIDRTIGKWSPMFRALMDLIESGIMLVMKPLADAMTMVFLPIFLWIYKKVFVKLNEFFSKHPGVAGLLGTGIAGTAAGATLFGKKGGLAGGVIGLGLSLLSGGKEDIKKEGPWYKWMLKSLTEKGSIARTAFSFGVMGAGLGSVLGTPGVIIGGIIGSLLGLMVGVATNIDKLTEAWNNTWEKIKEIVTVFTDKLKNIVEGITEGIGSKFGEILEAVKNIDIGELIKKALKTFLTMFLFVNMIPLRIIAGLVKKVKVKNIVNVLKSIFDTIVGIVNSIINKLGKMSSEIIDSILSVIRRLFSWIKRKIRGLFRSGGGKEETGKSTESHQTGGWIPSTGWYYLHEGEFVVPRHRVETARTGETIVKNINISINIEGSIDDAVLDRLKRELIEEIQRYDRF